MTFWALFVKKISTLVLTLGVILGFYSPAIPNTAVNENKDTPAIVELQKDQATTSPKIVIGGEEQADTPPEEEIFIDPSGILDIQRKIDEVRAEINRQISAKTPQPTPFSGSDINTKTRSALVNILCISDTQKVRSITGSGVVVDPRGVILTNSHIGQYFLLRDYPAIKNVNCTIRTGSPAIPKYEAELLYLSPLWINDNKTTIAETNPLGTGEHDYAFLIITKAITGEVPEEFNYLPMLISDGELVVSKNVVVAGYAAGFLGGVTVQKELYPVSALSKIYELFTFTDDTLDLISIGGSVVAQRGSSGGAVVDDGGNLIGVIVTSTEAVNTSDRDLRAVTISHINRSLSESRGSSISALLLGDIKNKSENFNSVEAPNLKQILVNSIESVI